MTELVLGKWNVICERCGFKFKNDQLQEEWTGRRVCAECWEPRHPQDFVRPIQEDTSVPWTAPEPADTFIEVTYIDSSVGTQENTVPTGTFNSETL